MALDTTIGGALTDSYATLAELNAYATAMGWTLTGTDAVKEAALRRSAVALDGSYGFIGVRTYQTQERAWPRFWYGLIDGWPVASDTIPEPVKNAQIELAYVILTGSNPLASYDGAVASERVKAGPVEADTVYSGGKARTRYTAVDRIIAPYTVSGAGQVRMVRG